MAAHARQTFQRFCESTSLHGYGYLLVAKSIMAKLFWAIIIVIMTIAGIEFMINNTKEYLESNLVTTIETSTAPLKEAVFPSIIVCNFNQLEASYLKDLDLYDNVQMTNLLIKEYMTGTAKNFSDEAQANLTLIKNRLGSKSPHENGMQRCENLFISMRFQKFKRSWHEIPHATHGEPFLVGTDQGVCCFLTPYLFSGQGSANVSVEELYHNLHAPAIQGEEDGLELLFDIEKFNYGYIRGKGVGFTMSLSDHRSKPLMQFSSVQLGAGRQNQIVVKPVITYTSKNALNSMSSDERGCFRSEQIMEVLPKEIGFRYEMNNCLIDQGILAIYWNCRCIPLLAALADSYRQFLEPCTGKKLHCAYEIMGMMGSQEYMNKTPKFIAEEALVSPYKIGNNTRKPHKVCLPGCQIQENQLVMSSSKYPPSKNFFFKKSFCKAATHILQVSCSLESRRYFLKLHYPNICQVLGDFELVFGNADACFDWPETYLDAYQEINQTLLNEMLLYGEDNLAQVTVFFQSPYMTKIKRDVDMTFTDFIANTGGLLGLYHGFSVISLIEILYFIASFMRDLIQ